MGFGVYLEFNYIFEGINCSWHKRDACASGASGRNQNHPQNHIYKAELNNFNVLEKEIEILNPDIILFISGPNYDSNISSILNGVEFSNLNENFSSRQIAKLNFKIINDISKHQFNSFKT